METLDVSLISRGVIERALPMNRCIELARVAYEATATGKALDSSLGHVTAPEPPHIEAIAAILELDTVRLWGRSPERTRAALSDLRARLPELNPEFVHDVRGAARDADLIVCLTPATQPYLHAADVSPGTTIAAVGSDTPAKQELSTDLLAGSVLVCDITQQCAEVGELHHALDAGVMTLSDVRAEIGEVIAGSKPGRQADDEVVIFDSTGTN